MGREDEVALMRWDLTLRGVAQGRAEPQGVTLACYLPLDDSTPARSQEREKMRLLMRAVQSLYDDLEQRQMRLDKLEITWEGV